MKWLKYFAVTLVLLLLGPLYQAVFSGETVGGWRDWARANRDSSSQAPLPADSDEAVIQVYSARTYSWRGHFAAHTWVTTKAAGADHYLVHQVIGFRENRGLDVRVSAADIPDRNWYGTRPELLIDVRGEDAARLLPAVLAAVESYPYPASYTTWPGPNSNTFTAHVGRQVPELGLVLPVTAIGKDYLPGGALIASTPSGTGYQFSLFGTLGVLAARNEGFEVNVLGLVAGIDLRRPALKIPGVGRVGTPYNQN
ncbi:MAG: DUF3750 domain-containing protein [Pseudomonadota bacterium]